MNEITEPIVTQTESIKLVRNAKGNYQWEIKVFIPNWPIGALAKDVCDSDIVSLQRLEAIDNHLKEKYIDEGGE